MTMAADTAKVNDIFTAIRKGSEDDVRKLLDNGIDVNITEGNSYDTPLKVAVDSGNIEVAKLLIERGANINAVGWGAKTILHNAVNKGNKEMIQLLLENGAETGAVSDKNGYSTRPIILHAIETKDEEIVKMIFKFEADAINRHKDYSLLHFAAENGTEKIVELLLNLGANVFAKRWGKTPLIAAIKSKNEKIVETLLNHEAKVTSLGNASQNESEPVLRGAIESGNVKIVQLVMNHGGFSFDLEKRHYSKTTLLSALSSGNVQEEIIQLLLDRGADVYATRVLSQEYTSALLHQPIAVAEYDIEFTRRVVGRVQTTTLHYAAKSGNEKIFRMILERGLNPLAENSSHKTTLHFAMEGGNENIVNFLLEQGANIHAKDDFDKTTLHYAVKGGNEKIVQLVLDNGVHVDSENKKGQTPLHLACKRGLDCIIQLILKYNPDLYVSYRRALLGGPTIVVKPLNLAIRSENYYEKCVKVLLDHGINVNDGFDDNDYEMPVESAVNLIYHTSRRCTDNRSMKKTILEQLLVYGADVDNFKIQCNNGIFQSGSYAYCVELITTYAKNVKAQDFLQDMQDAILNGGEVDFCVEEIKKTVIKQLVLLEIDFVEVIRGYDILKKFKVKCEEEIERLKSKFFDQSTVSYYNFMVTKDQNQLAWYVRNNNILKAFTSGELKATFPIYAMTLKSRFRKGMWRKLMLDRVKRFFHAVADSEGNEGLPKLPFNCNNLIIEQLSNKDLRMLIQVCDPVNGFNIDIDDGAVAE